MEITGTIKLVNDAQSFGAKDFTKREVVVTTEEQYPQDIMIEFVQDKCSLLDAFKAGQSVKISINLRGREWVNPEGVSKYFNTIQGWRIESHIEGANNESPKVDESSDDLPF
jgi:translation initiation factor IF-3